MKLSFVCPCFNEAQNVEPMLKAIESAFPIYEEYEVIFINDGSTDNTFEKLKELKMNSRSNIVIINFSRNFGKESAMYAGLENACGEIISIIDADLQQDPSIVKKMVELLDKNPELDCVCACQEERIENKFISACKGFFYKIADRFTDVSFKSGASDFRSFRRPVRDAILSLREYNRFSKGIFSWVGFNTMYIPYVANERQNGKSSFNMYKLIKYALNGIISFSTAPLKFATFMGGTTIVFSVIYSIITVIRKLVSNISVDGFTQLVMLISFLGGIQLFTLGIIGEYLAKNYIETKNRPIYIAKEILDYKKKD
ncbi:MAG: glycosyltransferase family 2 protein [Eubacterium sp.]|nr:glycosyltransferase family 2 protein [Eubacterium sp.]